MAATEYSLSVINTAALAAAEKFAENQIALDVSERLGITDAFLIASAESERQVNAIVDGIEEALIEKHDLRPVRREGRGLGRWVLLDYIDVVIHIQHQEDRVFYALDRLWSDCAAIELPAAARSVAVVEDPETSA
ncbi:MAG: ribosome silencing factor [Arthrobacter sp.]|uniref:ribosome silencing factor n=1 Tax=Actinomycetes TaxID=1760 RepID=UPI0026498401|nr:ribosome silencing factor [Corynebacterium sp.]MDN5814019.1 ribosome silencing factor [Micrococcaceae bacterium]MDN5720529.1 ribosome silencing factor [Corynebacterium sp.]MDN5823515.1 ribosome silencing factor [Micrococcaceae bacterium]MDN5879167.1 ribosome silencing factor [Micrococcaceae bacterium]MDN5886643.1 ribosome silencing factor [Micrococcaceae bacterium]